MRKKIKKIATSGIVGTLLFVSSGSVNAQSAPVATRSAQRDEMQDSEIPQTESFDVDVGVSASDSISDVQGEARQALLDQGFSASQIQKLNRRNSRN